jgi:hypothetical protein
MMVRLNRFIYFCFYAQISEVAQRFLLLPTS